MKSAGQMPPTRPIEERDREDTQQAIDAALARGLADAEAGRVIPLGDAFRQLHAELDLPRVADPG